ncbi:MAG: methyltransferase [Planctomycetaceae bacterium]
MLRLIFKDDGSEHEDLLLQFGEELKRGDSYYLALDRAIDPKDSSPRKVRVVLRAMFTAWLKALEVLPSERLYLLVDVSDQSTTWIEVTPKNEKLKLKLGWSTREGFSVTPSKDAVCHSTPDDFTAVTGVDKLKMSHEDLCDSIERCRRMLDVQECSESDPTSILEHYRGAYGSQLLVAAVSHFDLFTKLANGPLMMDELRRQLELEKRPFNVLTTALRAMELLEVDRGRVSATPQALAHLTAQTFDMRDYIGLMATSPDVLNMVELLRNNKPVGSDSDDGVAFIFRDGVKSAMDSSNLARHFTESLAGRAKIVAPVMARQIELPVDEPSTLLDVGGGSGIYSIALLARYPLLTATIMDSEEVLAVADEYAQRYGVDDRLTLLPGDMFTSPLPKSDRVLLSNILHDWDVPECYKLVQRCAEALSDEGQLLIHDVYLHDDLSGPLPIALYSAALFSFTEGRAYSAAEYQDWMEDAGLQVSGPFATAVHCGVLVGQQP